MKKTLKIQNVDFDAFFHTLTFLLNANFFLWLKILGLLKALYIAQLW